jgi:hypothetical protein
MHQRGCAAQVPRDSGQPSPTALTGARELDHDGGEVTATMKAWRKSINEKSADVSEVRYA